MSAKLLIFSQKTSEIKKYLHFPCNIFVFLMPFLKEDLGVVMCHYPMVTWNQKPRGSIMLHGHSHGKLDDYNAQSPDLRFDVGIDSTLANLRFLTLEDIYQAAYAKITQASCTTFAEYASNNYKSEVR